jgi:YYY domain-containing protein
LLTRLSGLNSAVTYNLQLATLFALAFTATFSLASNLLYKIQNTKYKILIAAGLLSAFLLTLGGNLHTVVYVLKNGADHYWYPDATRYIGYNPPTSDKTIHEFPIYSFVVSDLHGHVSDIPFVLLFLAITFSTFLNFKLNPKDFLISQFLNILISSVLLGVMYMTNSWDLPIYFIVLGLVLLWLNYQNFGFTVKMVINTSLLVIGYLLLAILFSFPFHLHFSQIAKGIGLVHGHSMFHQLLVLWGTPWFFGLTFLIFCLGDKLRAVFQPEFLAKKFASLLGVKVRLLKNQLRVAGYGLTGADFFVLILMAVATLLIILPEIFYVKDIYIPEYHRANTMFKLVYQSFMMYSVAGGYIIVRVLSSLKKSHRKFLFSIFYFLFSISVMIYPLFAIKSYYGSLKTYQGLYGLKFLERAYPDNYQAILWLQKNVVGQPVILEAVGDSYTDYNQISMATGLPTVEGWLVHEWLWRGSFDEPGKRAGEIQTIYEGDSPAAKPLLEKYQVKYIIVGNLERQKYQKLNETKLSSLGKIVFESGSTRVFEVQ